MQKGMNHLVEKIQAEAEAVKQNLDLARRDVRDMTRRAELCIGRLGRHIKKKLLVILHCKFIL